MIVLRKPNHGFTWATNSNALARDHVSRTPICTAKQDEIFDFGNTFRVRPAGKTKCRKWLKCYEY